MLPISLPTNLNCQLSFFQLSSSTRIFLHSKRTADYTNLIRAKCARPRINEQIHSLKGHNSSKRMMLPCMSHYTKTLLLDSFSNADARKMESCQNKNDKCRSKVEQIFPSKSQLYLDCIILTKEQLISPNKASNMSISQKRDLTHEMARYASSSRYTVHFLAESP